MLAVDLDSFCLDQYPWVHARFVAGMSRPERVNLLLESVQDDARIVTELDGWMALRREHSKPSSTRISKKPTLRWVGILGGILLATSIGGAVYLRATTKRTEDMVWLPGGSFVPAVNPGGAGSQPVYVRGFWLDRTEVTAEAYQLYNPRQIGNEDKCNLGKNAREHHPVNCINYFEALDYCHSLGKRLPTEFEWEYAARGGGTNPSFENNPTARDRVCWKRDSGTCVVGSFSPDGHGLMDLLGNVWEWTLNLSCNDITLPCVRSNAGVVRGGSWASSSMQYFGPPSRYQYPLTERNPYVGFRCAKDVTK